MLSHGGLRLIRFGLRDANLSHNSFLRKQTERAQHHVPFDGKLPNAAITRTWQFPRQSVVSSVVLKIDVAHEFRLTVDDLIGGNLYPGRIRRIDGNVIDHLLIMTRACLADADRFAGPVTG